MDETYDTSYLMYLNGKSQNYLLQNSDEILGVHDSNFTPILGENEDGSTAWTVEHIPILMSGTLMPDDQIAQSTENINNNSDTCTSIYNQQSQRESPFSNAEAQEESTIYPLEVPGKGFITAQGLFITNDLLFQLKEKHNSNSQKVVNEDELGQIELVDSNLMESDISQLSGKVRIILDDEDNLSSDNQNSDETHLNFDENVDNQLFEVPNLHEPEEIIQLFNADGTVTNINKSLFNFNVAKNQRVLPDTTEVITEHSGVHYEDFYEVIMAQKCRKCSFLSENKTNMKQHIENIHLTANMSVLNGQHNSGKKTIRINKSPINGEVKMKSILAVNNFRKPDQQTVYLCSECRLGYASTEDLKNHMIKEHKLIGLSDEVKSGPKEESIKDDNTKVVNKMQISAALIRKKQKASKKIKCSIKGCELRFTRDELRARHEECHIEGKKKQFKCSSCDEKFFIWRVCSIHLWKCHSIDTGLLTCPMCNKFKASTPVRLLTHMAIHDDEKPFLCSTCGKTFKQFTQLRNHQVIHETKDKVPEWATQQQCEICEKYFANHKTLKKHIQSVHHQFKPFMCNICGHKTTRKAMLNLHLRQHTGEKPYKCTICTFRTGDHNSLRRHVMRHKGDMKYSCPHCDYKSIQSTAYKNHIANKHPGLGGSYFCVICTYHTVNEIAYLAHMKAHENGSLREKTLNHNRKNETIQHKLDVITGEKEYSEVTNKITSLRKELEDEETQNCYLSSDHTDETIDTGGITIPAVD